MVERGLLAAAAMLALTGAAHARTPPDAAALKAIEAQVPPQSWYPAGYYDIRIAAEGQIAEKPRRKKDIVSGCYDSGERCYDLMDCQAEYVDFDPGDMALSRFGDAALEVSRLRREFVLIGYPVAVYSDPLAAYERALIAEAAARTDAQMRRDAGLDQSEEGADDVAADETFDDVSGGDALDPLGQLAADMEARRQALAPRSPRVIIDGGCGAGDGGPVIVRTIPPGGEVLLMNAFAFKVCTRTSADPWNPLGCRWNQIETGVTQNSLSGRYVFQVRWPDGTVRKGTREIEPEYDSETAMPVTFRKTGS